jgi:predicted amidophosphoribosyltransferase
MKERGEMHAIDPDAVVPVPIHWSRRAERGFNQAEEIAVRLGLKPYMPALLRRSRATPPQTRARGPKRRSQLQDAFEAEPCRGRRILLVDDVITSGGTVEACAKALKLAEASWVGAVSFARELPNEMKETTQASAGA